MPAALPDHLRLSAHSFFAQGLSIRQVANKLGISSSSAWKLKSDDRVDPDAFHLVSKTLANKLLLASSGATDALLDQIEEGKLAEEKPIELAKIASITAQAAGAYSMQSGAADTLSQLMTHYGLEPSQSVSRVTVTQQIAVESTPQPVVVHGLENASNQ